MSKVPFWIQLKTFPPILLYAVAGGFIIGYLRYSVLWLGLLLYFLNSFVFGEIDRTVSILKAQVYRENVNFMLSNDSETVEWLNHVLSRLWIAFYPDVSESIASNIRLVLESAKPAFLDSIKLPIFSLGATAPTFSNARVNPSLDQDLINLDIDFKFEPICSDDFKKLGTRIQLIARVVKVVFQDFLKNLIKSALSGFVSPNTYHADIEQMFNSDSASLVSMAVARITVKQARDLPNMESLGTIFNSNNVSDVFTKIIIKGETVAKTKVIDDSLDPIWNESFYVFLPHSDENILFQLYHNSTVSDVFIGQSIIEASENSSLQWFNLKNKTGEKEVKGQLRAKIDVFNRIDQGMVGIIESSKSSSPPDIVIPTLNKGILHFNITEAKDVSIYPGVIPVVVASLNGKEIFKTAAKKSSKPVWNERKEMFIQDFANDVIELTLMDSRQNSKLGWISFPATKFKELDPKSSDWHTLDIPKTGVKTIKGMDPIYPRLKFSALFYPVDARDYDLDQPPKIPGILEIILIKGSKLAAVNLDGKTSDPFVVLEINNTRIYKSGEYSKNINPVFTNDPVIGVLLFTTDLDTLMIKVRDHQSIGKHKPMGNIYFDLSKLISFSEQGDIKCDYSEKYMDVNEDVILDGANAGKINFKIRFRTIKPEVDYYLRRTKEGNVTSNLDDLSLDAKSLLVLNEASMKGTTTFFGFSQSSKLGLSVGSLKKSETNLSLDVSARGILEIKLIKAANLLPANYDQASSDPFVNVEFGVDQIYKSQTYAASLNPSFVNEKLITHSITLERLLDTEFVLFRVKDYNKFLANKLIGEAKLYFNRLLDFEPCTEKSQFSRKNVDGTYSVLKELIPWNGPLNLILDQKLAGEIHVSARVIFPDFRSNVPENHTAKPLDDSKSLKSFEIMLNLGPAHPFAQDMAGKNIITGFIQSHSMNEASFNDMQRTFMNHGYTLDPDTAQVVGNTRNTYNNKTIQQGAVFNRKLQKKRKKNSKPDDIQGFAGPWAKYEGETSEDENIPAPGSINDLIAPIPVPMIVPEEADVIIKAPTAISKESTKFHGKDEVDYLGRTYLHPPNDVEIDLTAENAGTQDCFLPKKLIHTWVGHTKGVNVIRYLPKTAHLLLSASADSKVKIWDVYHERNCLRTFSGHDKGVKDITFSNDGRQFLSAGLDKAVKLWDTETGACISRFTTKKIPNCVVFNPDEDKQNIFLVGCQDKKIYQFDVKSGKLSQEYDQHLGGVNSITFIENNQKFISSSEDKTLRVWEYGSPSVIKTITAPSMLSMPAVTVSPSQKWLAYQSLANHICVYSTDKIKPNHKKTFKGHIIAEYAIKPGFSPDGKYMTSGDSTGTVWFWDWKTANLFKKFKAHEGVVMQTEWHPLETSKIATCSLDATIKYWD